MRQACLLDQVTLAVTRPTYIVDTNHVRQPGLDRQTLYPSGARLGSLMNMSGGQVRAGLWNDEFVPFFQPVATLHSGEVAGVEILARWQHGSLGIVPPGAFIATAEQEGRQVSPHLLRDLALPIRIREAAEAAAFPLDRVVIEITESA